MEGAHGDDHEGYVTGSAYIFDFDGTTGTETAKIGNRNCKGPVWRDRTVSKKSSLVEAVISQQKI